MVRSRHQSTRSDLDSVVGGRRDDQRSRMAGREVPAVWHRRPAAPMERAAPRGEAGSRSATPPRSTRFLITVPRPRASAAALSLARSAAALDLGRLSHVRVRLLLSRRCRLHWAGRVRRAQQNDADVVFALARLRAVSHGPFEAHWHSKRLMFFFFSHSSVLPCSLNDFNLCCGVASP